VLASIGSGAPGTQWGSLLPANSTTVVVFAGAAFVILVCPLGFVKNARLLHAHVGRYPTFAFRAHTREMDVEHSLNPSLYEGEPMVIDGLEQGLLSPHVVGEDGQHTVQHIDK